MFLLCNSKSNLYKNSLPLIIAAVLPIAGNKRLVGICAGILHIHNSRSDHLHQREAFAETGNPCISLVTVRICGYQAVTPLAGLQGKINFLRLGGLLKYLAGNVGRKMLLYKFLPLYFWYL